MSLLEGIHDPALRKLIDALKDSIVRPDGTKPTGFSDQVDEPLVLPSVDEVVLTIHVLSPFSARITISPRGPGNKGAKDLTGMADTAVLYTKLT